MDKGWFIRISHPDGREQLLVQLTRAEVLLFNLLKMVTGPGGQLSSFPDTQPLRDAWIYVAKMLENGGGLD